MAIATGIIAPPPMAVTARAAIIQGRLGANTTNTDPRAKMNKHPMKTLRRPKISETRPMRGIVTTYAMR